jgi:hypothetical protein
MMLNMVSVAEDVDDIHFVVVRNVSADKAE